MHFLFMVAISLLGVILAVIDYFRFRNKEEA